MTVPDGRRPGSRASTRPLDFVVIGAQKSGTTTLFEALRRTSGVFVPTAKEVPFFDAPVTAADYEGYLRRHFASARSEQRWGTVSPQYLPDPLAPARLSAICPGCRVVVVLREPVERLVSHYVMEVRRGRQTAPLEEVLVAELCVPPTEQHYIRGSLYGHWLRQWREAMPGSTVVVLWTRDLVARPDEVASSLEQALRVDGVPRDVLSQRFYRGGDRPRIAALDRLRRTRFGRRVRRALPRGAGDVLALRLDRWNVRPSEPPAVPVELQDRLRSVFSADAEELREVTGLVPPWTEACSGPGRRQPASDPA